MNPGAFDHYGKRIATIVTPNDCAQCHEKESKRFQGSHHAKAGDILGSPDNFLGEVVEGPPAAVSGCKQGHGSIVKILPNGKIDPTTWPNTGIGRINPDGSKGACAACHNPKFTDAFFTQYGITVELYNEKFARPAGALMKKLREAGKITPTQFDDKIEWTYFLLWHHEGRRARHGASMMAPDYTQWHGEQHKWRKGISREERDNIRRFYEERYGR